MQVLLTEKNVTSANEGGHHNICDVILGLIVTYRIVIKLALLQILFKFWISNANAQK